jgi:hypothetical protein
MPKHQFKDELAPHVTVPSGLDDETRARLSDDRYGPPFDPSPPITGPVIHPIGSGRTSAFVAGFALAALLAFVAFILWAPEAKCEPRPQSVIDALNRC